MGDASNDKETTPAEAGVRFVVTGFGPFQSVKTNPTSIMSEKLMDYLKNHEEKSVQSLESRTTTTVIETSAEAVRAYLDGLSKESLPSETTTVLLHMGVNYKGKGFQLEQCAYNDATFRIPDEKGFQPTKECVVAGLEWDKTLTTPLDVKGLCEKLHQKYPGSDAPVVEEKKEDEEEKEETKEETTDSPSNKRRKLNAEGEKAESVEASTEAKDTTTAKDNEESTPIRIFPSTDPGRYVCNYTYCYSLNKFCSEPKDDKNKCYSLFLHVPPFKLIPEEDQLKFVVDLMQLIDEAVSKAPE